MNCEDSNEKMRNVEERETHMHTYTHKNATRSQAPDTRNLMDDTPYNFLRYFWQTFDAEILANQFICITHIALGLVHTTQECMS